MDSIEIAGRKIGRGYPVYIVAEISANHAKDIRNAETLIESAKNSGADAVKVQTYTPDTLTIDSDNIRIGEGSCWSGKLYDLYKEAYAPWEWYDILFDVARDVGITLFSTVYDYTSTLFLKPRAPAYKIASFEIVDIPLLRCVAETKKPIILSTGMATWAEVDEAVKIIRANGNENIALLKCTSAYPAPIGEMNLRGIQTLMGFGTPVGLSDHTTGIVAPVAAVALGACIIEKHIMLDGSKSPDSGFSLTSSKFREMVTTVRSAEASLGNGILSLQPHEEPNFMFRKSIYVVEDIKKGEKLNPLNIRVIRPGNGMHSRWYYEVIGKCTKRDIPKGTPLSKDDIE